MLHLSLSGVLLYKEIWILNIYKKFQSSDAKIIAKVFFISLRDNIFIVTIYKIV